MHNRLFANEILYSEGLHKPFWRGKIHALSFILLPFAIWKIAPYNSPLLYISLASNVFCFGCSAFYHIVPMSVNMEIYMQKLDHFSISLWCHGMMYPIMFFALSRNIGFAFFVVNIGFFLWNTKNIIQSTPSIIGHVMVPGSLAPFLYWAHMPFMAWYTLIGVILFQSIGTFIFSIKKPQNCFHEIFHLLTIGSAICVFFTNLYVVL